MKRLLDLFSCAGGAGYGYRQAGFHVTGVDIAPQKHYAGDVFVQADALEYVLAHGWQFDAIHASPPCQRYSEQTPPERRDSHPDLIAPTRFVLRSLGLPYVMENVEGAKHLLKNPIMVCGTQVGLPRIWRHRYFECPWLDDLPFLLQHPCCHAEEPVLLTGMGNKYIDGKRRKRFTMAEKKAASGIDWMTGDELTEAIPPAYTKFIGERLMHWLEQRSDDRLSECSLFELAEAGD